MPSRSSSADICAYLWTVFLCLLLIPGCGQPETSGERGQEHFNRGEWDQAVAALSEAIAAEPENHRWVTLRGRAYFGSGQRDKAIADYREAIRIAPEDAEAYYNRAIAYRAAGDAEKAFADDQQARRLDPEHAQAYLFLDQPEIAIIDAQRAAVDTVEKDAEEKVSTEGAESEDVGDLAVEDELADAPAFFGTAESGSSDQPLLSDVIAGERAARFNIDASAESAGQRRLGRPSTRSARTSSMVTGDARTFRQPIPQTPVRPTGRLPAADAELD